MGFLAAVVPFSTIEDNIDSFPAVVREGYKEGTAVGSGQIDATTATGLQCLHFSFNNNNYG